MKFPPYQDRSKAELERALRWAIGKLHLEQWDVTLFVDEDGGDEYLKQAQAEELLGRNHYWVDELRSRIGIFSAVCKEKNVDPRSVVFHETAHLVTDIASYVGKGDLAVDQQELLTCRIEWLLNELWQHEQTPKRSD